ncbi:DUF3488 domain-containing protein [Myxococcota bacterium]|nr:DUF3488 domain-containing protein [Myxococcota bacterium]MBU1433169.1 DUF3488 domain-containing protein [Myxococcota bacterium]
MKFIIAHKLSTYLMVGISLISLTSWISPIFPLISILLLIHSWSSDPKSDRPILNLFKLFYVALSISIVIFYLSRSDFLKVIILILSITTLKFSFSEKINSNYAKLYISSLINIGLSGIMGSNAIYLITLSFYSMFSVFSIIMFQLKKEMEDNYLLKYRDSLKGKRVKINKVLHSKKLVSKKFNIISVFTSFLIIALSFLIFTLIPRVNKFDKLSQINQNKISGFSDEVRIGEFGLIKNNYNPVIVIKNHEYRDNSYWKGVSLDFFDGKSWYKSQKKYFQYRADRDAHINQRDYSGITKLEQFDIDVIDIKSNILFKPSEDPLVIFDENDQNYYTISYDQENDFFRESLDLDYMNNHFSYRVIAKNSGYGYGLSDISINSLKFPQNKQKYLQLPSDIHDDFQVLSESIKKQSKTLNDVTDNISTAFKQYKYSTSSKNKNVNDFFLRTKSGHCEYFSTVAIILLRQMGIPSRNINGFYGGRWNPQGNFLIMSGANAHSWVEIWTDKYGWVIFDPTPTSHITQNGLFYQPISNYIDFINIKWHEFIKNNSVDNKYQHILSVINYIGKLDIDLKLIMAILILIISIVAIIIAIKEKIIAINAVDHPHPLKKEKIKKDLYQMMIDFYAQRGLMITNHMTHVEILALLRARGAPGLSLAEEICDTYERARFGAQPIDPEQRARLRHALSKLGSGFAKTGDVPQK